MATPQDSLFDSVDFLNRQIRSLGTPVLEAEDVNRVNSIVLNAFLQAGVTVLQGLTDATKAAMASVEEKTGTHGGKRETSHKVAVK
jgi:hypothetical protein